MPCVMRGPRATAAGATLSAVGLSLMLSLWPGTFSFLAVSHFTFETFKNQTKSESAAKAAQSLVTDTPHATRPGPTPITVKNKYQKRKSFYSLNNSASRSRELLRPCEVRREVGESYASVCCSMLGAHTAYYIASLCEAAHHEPSTTSLMFAYMPATPPRAPAHATK